MKIIYFDLVVELSRINILDNLVGRISIITAEKVTIPLQFVERKKKIIWVPSARRFV